jgi:MYXO-CTERM domain-containing protein
VIVLVAAFGLRVGYMALTPGYKIVHDARDYDFHARSVAKTGDFSTRLTGMPTAFRPPGYVYLLAGAYKAFGVEGRPAAERIPVARRLGEVLGTLGVGLIGVLAAQLWGRRTALVAMALAAIYLPSILVAEAIMSEQLFVVFMLAALVTALHRRGSPRFAALAGFLAGLAVLTRANGLILLAPLALAVWPAPRLKPRSLLPPALLIAVALLTVSPWTIRNAVELDHFVPVTTQLGTALAGTYNEETRADHVNPGSWRSLRRVPEYAPFIAHWRTTNEAAREQRLRKASYHFIGEHPGFLATVLYWNTRRILDLASLTWSRHTASTISVDPGWADAGVFCFWAFALLALAGATLRAARRPPALVWLVPVAMYASVVFLAAETPRYRAPIDPFVILLAALVLMRLAAARVAEPARAGMWPT